MVEKELEECRYVLLYPQQDVTKEQVVRLCDRLQKMNSELEIVIGKDAGEQEKIDTDQFDKVIHFCRHVKDMEKDVLPEIYIGIYGNMIANEQDYIYFRNYENSYVFFRESHHDSVIETIWQIRKEGIKDDI